MKNIIVFMAILGMLPINAYCALRCIRQQTILTPTVSGAKNSGPIFSLTYNNMPIRGIGYCASTRTTMIGTAYSSVIVSNTATDNAYCYCKVFSPFESKWVFVQNFAVASSCLTGCPGYCNNALSLNTPDYEKVRTAIFNNIIQ